MTNKYVEKSKIFAQMILYGFRAPDMTVTEFVDDLPVADVQEVKHGYWFRSKKVAFAEECSVCGCTIYHHDGLIIRYPYCPHCGAKMDEEVDGKENEK